MTVLEIFVYPGLFEDSSDMFVFGYVYHKRGSEDWCNIVGPLVEDCPVINGNIPASRSPEHSYSNYLESSSL